jgi:hypothetical protein
MTPRYEWGKKLEEQTLYKRPPRVKFLSLPLSSAAGVDKPNSLNFFRKRFWIFRSKYTRYSNFDDLSLLTHSLVTVLTLFNGQQHTKRRRNTKIRLRTFESDTTSKGQHWPRQRRAGSLSNMSVFIRYRLLNRHAAEYKKWKADVEMSIDVETTFRQDIKPTQLGIGMLQQSYQIISSPNTKEALVRLPASKRNVLVSIEQLRQLEPPPEKLSESELEWSATEFAAEIARQAVEERRRMMVEEIDMRLFHAEAMDLYYTVMMRADPVKYPKGPTKNQPTQPPSKKPMTANMPSSAVPGQGVGYSASSGHSTSAIPSAQAGSPAVARDPRLERAQDPRLNPRR